METESGNIVEVEWREEDAQHIIDVFANHFWGPDQTPWQWKMI